MALVCELLRPLCHIENNESSRLVIGFVPGYIRRPSSRCRRCIASLRSGCANHQLTETAHAFSPPAKRNGIATPGLQQRLRWHARAGPWYFRRRSDHPVLSQGICWWTGVLLNCSIATSLFFVIGLAVERNASPVVSGSRRAPSYALSASVFDHLIGVASVLPYRMIARRHYAAEDIIPVPR